MRQLIPKIPIHPGSGNRADQRDEDNRGAGADLSEKGPRASARHSPTQAEDQAAVYLAFIELFRMKSDGLAVDTFCLEFFNQKNRQRADHDRCADNAVHVKGFQPEHFLNTKPGYDLCLHEGDAKKDPDERVFKVVPPGVRQLRLVHAHRVEGTHFEVGLWVKYRFLFCGLKGLYISHCFFQFKVPEYRAE